MIHQQNWDASAFFQRLTEHNKLAQQKGFYFCRVSGLTNFQELLSTMQTQKAYVCVDEISEGYIELNNTPNTRRVKTVFLAMRHPIDNEEKRAECMEVMRELFRQFMSVLIREQTKLQENMLYLDSRIRFTEIPKYFASGCACAKFLIAVDSPTDLQLNMEEWLQDD